MGSCGNRGSKIRPHCLQWVYKTCWAGETPVCWVFPHLGNQSFEVSRFQWISTRVSWRFVWEVFPFRWDLFSWVIRYFLLWDENHHQSTTNLGEYCFWFASSPSKKSMCPQNFQRPWNEMLTSERNPGWFWFSWWGIQDCWQFRECHSYFYCSDWATGSKNPKLSPWSLIHVNHVNHKAPAPKLPYFSPSLDIRFFVRKEARETGIVKLTGLPFWGVQTSCWQIYGTVWVGVPKKDPVVNLTVYFAFEVTTNLRICFPGYSLRIRSHGAA